MRDVDLEYYTRLRERLEILTISEFLQNLSAKLRSRIASLDSGEFNDENIRPSLPPVANLALVDFVSGFLKVLHRVLDGEQGLSFLVSKVELVFCLYLIVIRGNRAKQHRLHY